MGTVYPNPTNQSINIEFGLAQKENVEISVYDVFGNIISGKICMTIHKDIIHNQ
jgi:hypothetical protein